MNTEQDNPRACSSVRPAIVRASHAHGVLGMGRTRFWEIAKTEGFPRPIVLSRRMKGYLVAELEQWAATAAPRG